MRHAPRWMAGGAVRARLALTGLALAAPALAALSLAAAMVLDEQAQALGRGEAGAVARAEARRQASGQTAGQTASRKPAIFPTIDVRVPATPAPLVAGGRTHLVYELHVANLTARETRITAVEVRDRDAAPAAAPLLRLEGAALDGAMRRAGAPQADEERRVLTPGRLAFVFLWVTLPEGAKPPAALTHRIATTVAAAPPPPGSATAPAATPAASGAPPSPSPSTSSNAPASSATPAPAAAAAVLAGASQDVTVDGVEVLVSARAPRAIGPPLQGDRWLAGNGPDNTSGHRRALIAAGGEAHIAQRFAIDWVRLFDDGRTWKDDRLKNASYRCYGANALAVADGIVSDTHDGIPENVPGPTSRAVPITPDTLGGNFIVLDIGQGAFAFYAHLQPGSLNVKKGDRVRRGQVLGLVGNSGNSTEPHLHFHLTDRNAAIGAEGVPYAFESFDLQVTPDRVRQAMASATPGHWMDGAVLTAAAPPNMRRLELPLLNAVIGFAAR